MRTCADFPRRVCLQGMPAAIPPAGYTALKFLTDKRPHGYAVSGTVQRIAYTHNRIAIDKFSVIVL